MKINDSMNPMEKNKGKYTQFGQSNQLDVIPEASEQEEEKSKEESMEESMDDKNDYSYSHEE